MKKILSTLIVTALLTGTASADQNNRKKGVDIDQVISSLQLETTAATNLKSLMKSHQELRSSLRQQGKKNREQRQAMRKQHRQAVLDIIGEDKMSKFEEIMHQNRPKGKRHNRKNKQQES